MQTHNAAKATGAIPVEGHRTWKIACGGCGWSLIVATASAPPLQQCPYCGWEEISPVQEGSFATLLCATHGSITCVITDIASHPEDYMSLYCPHCRCRPGTPRA